MTIACLTDDLIRFDVLDAIERLTAYGMIDVPKENFDVFAEDCTQTIVDRFELYGNASLEIDFDDTVMDLATLYKYSKSYIAEV